MRSISAAYEEIITADPNTALTAHSIRRLILQKQIPYVMPEQIYFEPDALFEYLIAPPIPAEPKSGTIRRINS
jgi:hypothetical protein